MTKIREATAEERAIQVAFARAIYQELGGKPQEPLPQSGIDIEAVRERIRRGERSGLTDVRDRAADLHGRRMEWRAREDRRHTVESLAKASLRLIHLEERLGRRPQMEDFQRRRFERYYLGTAAREAGVTVEMMWRRLEAAVGRVQRKEPDLWEKVSSLDSALNHEWWRIRAELG
jgi:hypothetical protein